MSTHSIFLHGRLRKQFGARFDLDVPTPAMAFRALITVVPGFREAISQGAYRVIRGTLGKGVHLSAEMLGLQLDGRALHVVPAAVGSKSGGAGKIIVGAVIMVAAIATAYFTGGTSLAWGASMIGMDGVATAGSVAVFGAMMMVAGIASMLAGGLKINSSKPITDQSYNLSGAINSTQEGAPIPLIYGRCRVGSVVIAAAYEATALETNASWIDHMLAK